VVDRHFTWHLAGIPGTAAGTFMSFVPLWGTIAGIRDGSFGAEGWKDALPWLIPGLMLILGKRGVSVDPATREVRLWLGFAITRFLVLPVLRRRRRAFRRILIRRISNPPPKGGLPTRRPAVFLIDAEDRWSLVGRTWTHRGAVRMAERLARLSGLPLE